MKKIAFYLPQYHCIPENDEWWGKGFTEWVNVKKATPLFTGHNQPEIPLDKNYYNLLDKEVQEEQSKIALCYGLDAFCYYHYWFDGKLLLEKPMEQMLSNKNIKIPFCISWANESWARTWDGRDSHILIKQNQNESRESWIKHYEYLSKFFCDKRYLKNQNKPVFIIYKPQLIGKIRKFMECWDKLAQKDGFDGIYWGYQHPSAFLDTKVIDMFDFGIEFEPLYTDTEMEGKRAQLEGMRRILYAFQHPRWGVKKIKKKILKLPSIKSYDEVWGKIITRKPKRKNIQPGAFPAWDNTPRKGKNGIVFWGASPDKFKRYLSKQCKRAKEIYHAEYIFINAWNEWGEGAHLEPDEKNQFGYLEALKECER